MNETPSYKRRVIILILFFSLFKLIVSASIDLGNDESYYWLFSQVLKWNYFDHPPLVSVWIRIFTLNLLLDKYVIFLRLGSIVACCISTWFMYKCVATLSTEKAGWYAACIYNVSFYTAISAGLFILPDAPQMVFYTFSLWMIARITLNDKWIYWILLGVASGLCIMSKVHGVFIWIGLGLYVVFFRREWLLNFRLYTALAIALLITCPILIWNIHYDFATYRFNSARIVVKGFSINWYSFFKEFFGQIFINNPFNTTLIFASLFAFFRHKINLPKAFTIYNLISLPLIFLLLFISLYRDTLPHWTGPAYVSLIPLAAVRLSQVSRRFFYPIIIRLGFITFATFMIVCPLLINYYPGAFGSKSKQDHGKGDLTLDMYGWKKAGEKFDTIYKNETANGIMPVNAPVICNKWWGAHTEYYFCRPLNIPMMGLNKMIDLHEYLWMNGIRKDKADLSSAYCIINSDDYYDVNAAYRNYYNHIDMVDTINLARNGKPAHHFYVFRLKGWKNSLPVADH